MNADLFLASSRFITVATGLEKMANRERLSEQEMQTSRWAGQLLGEMDLSSQDHGKYQEISALATQLRPLFYQIIIENRTFTRDLLDRTYRALTSLDTICLLSPPELKHAYNLFQGLADRALDEHRELMRQELEGDD